MLLAEQYASLLPVFLGLAPRADDQGEALPADWSVVTSTTVTPQVGGFDMLLAFQCCQQTGPWEIPWLIDS